MTPSPSVFLHFGIIFTYDQGKIAPLNLHNSNIAHTYALTPDPDRPTSNAKLI